MHFAYSGSSFFDRNDNIFVINQFVQNPLKKLHPSSSSSPLCFTDIETLSIAYNILQNEAKMNTTQSTYNLCSLMLECHLDGINKYMVLICIFCKSGEVHVVVGFLCFTCQNFMFYLCKTFILWLYDPCVSLNVFYLIIIIFGY